MAIVFRIAWQNLLAHRRRNSWLAAAIAVVTALFVILTAFSAGVQETITKTAVALSTGHLNVNGVFKVRQNQALPILADYEGMSKLLEQRVPAIDFVVHRGRGGGRLVGEGVSLDIALTGVNIDAEPALRETLVLEKGSLERLKEPRSLLLFQKEAKALGVDVGDAVTISTETVRGVANTMDCVVVAVARDIGLLSANNAFAAIGTLRELYKVGNNVTGNLQIHVKEAAVDELPVVAAQVRQVLSDAGYQFVEPRPGMFWNKLESYGMESWTGQKIDLTSWLDEVGFMMQSFGVLRGVSALLIIVMMGIMTVGTMNGVWISVRERTREIGALRAIGMPRKLVRRLFLIESGLLGMLAAVVGVLGGCLLGTLINLLELRVPLSAQLFVMSDQVKLILLPGSLVFVVVLMSIVASVSAIYPAFRAARKRPVDALAQVG